MKRARAVLWVALASSAASVSSALAADAASPAPARVQLEYRREGSAASCVSAEQLMSAVEARLGRAVFAPADEAELRASVVARRSAGIFAIEIALFDRTGRGLGTRRLTTRARHCSALDDSLALVLSLAADVPRAEPPASTLPAAPVSPAPPVSEPAAPPVTSPPARATLGTPLAIPATTHAPRLGLRLEPTLGLAIVGGLMPRVGYGLELGLTLRANAFWPVSIRGTGWAAQRRELEAGVRGATFSAQTLELGVCPWSGEWGPRSMSVCALQWVGRGRARGFGFEQAARRDAWLIQFGLGVTLTHWVGPLFVSASGAALVPAVRRRYYFVEGVTDGAGITLHEQPWLSPSAAVRVGTEI
jgi:hypothetical protein